MQTQNETVKAKTHVMISLNLPSCSMSFFMVLNPLPDTVFILVK